MNATYSIQDTMGTMPYGLYIVGSRKDEDLDGMMADWVMQVSFEPRQIAVSFENDAQTLANIRETGGFAVSLLSEDEPSMALAAKFAQPYLDAKIGGRAGTLTRVHHKIDVVPHFVTSNGYPVVAEAIAWLECRATEYVPVGDHTLVIGQVRDGAILRDGNPLTSTFTGWNYSG